VARIAFGGGSPNAIAPEEMEALVARLEGQFDAAAATISVELDPRCFDDRWTQALHRIGVSRASLGVQSFDPEVQARIGRVQPTDMIAAVTQSLRDAGVTSINYDLMYGLPGQGIRELETSLATALQLAPDRLAVFGYAHVPHLLPRQRRIDATALPDGYLRFRQAAFAHHLLGSVGYVPVGFDHFARAGDPLAQAAETGKVYRNFQGFTDDPSQVLIGLGASAISQFPTLIVQNEKSAGRYRMRTLAGQFAVERGVARSISDQLRGQVISDLLCHGRAAVPRSRFPVAVAALRTFEAAGLVEWEEGVLAIDPGALAYARAIAAAFDPYRQLDPRRFSSAV
jgi:oxygen-independent coproporphyrinogen-3 oxidase